MSEEVPSGRVIDGRFTLVERLGSGGMGMVWRARDEALHRDVALKEVRPPDPALAEYDPEGARTLRARVLREARALARVDHPNVVTVHHIVDPGEDGYPWIVMELVAGSSLHDRLATGPMEPDDAAELGRGILSALRAAHAAGIQHRDVKPANVLLRPDGRPVLTDFGIAAIRESTSLTMTGALIGSPDYIAPERIRGTEGDPSSDLWSLGMMLYVAVEGRHPLRRATTLATLAAVLDEEIPPPVRAGALAPVLSALLTRDIPARPDAATLDRLLDEAARGVGSTPPTPTQPVRERPASAHPVSAHPVSAHPGSVHAAPTQSAATPPPRPGPAPFGAPEDRVPTGYGTPPPASDTVSRERGRRIERRVWRISAASSVVSAVVIAGAILWTAGAFSSEGSGGDDLPRDRASAPQVPAPTPDPIADGSDEQDVPGADAANLLTPDGARTAIEALKPLMGGTKVTDFTLYGEHASAEAPLKSNAALYDRFSYRDGRAKNDDMGGTLMSGSTTVDLDSVDWDALPALLKAAEKTLNVEDPESSYVIVDPSSPFHDDRPVLRVYVSDAHGGAFLTAELDGRVIEKNPRPKG
ncbi:serine/threonine-protein kinase [Streptomyces rubiginosohelvolus]|uniref:non-specific serine/threonine protein kinase n=1 Tax=Streptomyces rubiginosohelvolus TaxID=67362 RepID=A0ABQ3BBZ4_9ACTN|nr:MULTISPECIES: serine/threonine-protein kinase [Streptomyces]GGR94481.1 protein kinase [Streptomyces rubiginosohelvolus]GGZ34173.1 protein kinase [Streptomyces pluricolorescens]